MSDDFKDVEKASDWAQESDDWSPPAAATSSKKKSTSEMRSVRLLNMDVYQGRYLVVDEQTSEAYLVPKEHLTYTSGSQEVAKSILDVADRPYDWTPEIQALALTVDEMRLGLWFAGLVEPASLDFKEFVAQLLRSGKLAIHKEK